MATVLVAEEIALNDGAASEPNCNCVRECLKASEFSFELGNDTTTILPLIGYLQARMLQFGLVDPNDSIRMGTVLYEVLLNAIEHGNLELSSRLRETDDGVQYRRLGDERRQQWPYKDRRVHLKARFTPDRMEFVVRDEGNGYDSEKLLDPTDPANVLKASGRGLLLIRTFMDEVRFNEAGNEIALMKCRSR